MLTQRILAIIFVLTFTTVNAHASSKIYFYCQGPGNKYQITFEPSSGQSRAIQTIHKINGATLNASAHGLKTPITQYKATPSIVTYTKQNYRFSINRKTGTVFRDNKAVSIHCSETQSDLILEAKSIANHAQTTRSEFWTPQTAYGDTQYVQLGILASPNDICEALSHPIFYHSDEDYSLLDKNNSNFSWTDIDSATIWIRRKFKEKGVQLSRFNLMKNMHIAANSRLSECLAKKNREAPGFYKKITRHFLINLGYLGIDCITKRFESRKLVDDAGRVNHRQIAVERPSCINFNYNSGRLDDWNPSTFTLLIIWKEAHPVLKAILDRGEQTLLGRIAARNQRLLVEATQKKERQLLAEAIKKKLEREWLSYKERRKTLMEQVYNFATTGRLGGLKRMRWVEEQPCVLSDGSRRIDNRKINMTAFRIYKKSLGLRTFVESSDGNIRFLAREHLPVDRLRRAWGLAFQKCPGKTSRF